MKKKRPWDPYSMPDTSDRPEGGADDLSKRAADQARRQVPGNYNPEFDHPDPEDLVKRDSAINSVRTAPRVKAKSPKMSEQPEEDDDSEGDGSPTPSDSADNKKARRAIFMNRLMGKKK